MTKGLIISRNIKNKLCLKSLKIPTLSILENISNTEIYTIALYAKPKDAFQSRIRKYDLLSTSKAY